MVVVKDINIVILSVDNLMGDIYPPSILWYGPSPLNSTPSSPVSPLISDTLTGVKRGVNPLNEIKSI